MPLIDTVIRNASGVKSLLPIYADVTLHGIKRPDVAKFKYTIQSSIQEEDEISYIQDVVDVTFLNAIWNFQLSARDERGYNFDAPDPSEDRFHRITDINNRFLGNYALDFNAQNQGITVPATTELNARCDLSKQFDIFIWCTPENVQFISGNNEPILFSKYNGNSGLEIGISNTSGGWNPFVRFVTSNGTATVTGSEVIPTNQNAQPTLLRVWKDQTNTLRLAVNDTEEMDLSVSPNNIMLNDSILQSDADIIFGNGNGGNDHYRGLINQIRLYSGSYLSNEQATTIYASKFTATTMKFAGIIINVNDDGTKKTAQCRSWGEILFSKQLSQKLYEGNNAPAIRTGNVYATTNSLRPVLEDMISLIDDTLLLRTKETLDLVHDVDIIGIGKVSSLMGILLENLDLLFTVTSRKLVVIEDIEGIGTNYVFRHDGNPGHNYHVISGEQRNFKAVSDVLLIGHDGTEGYQRNVNRNKALVLRLPFVTGASFLQVLSQQITRHLNSRLQRFEVKSPILTNHIRPFQEVCVITAKGDVHELPIAEINYLYPAGKTVIQVGTNAIDYYDYQTELDSQVRGISDFPPPMIIDNTPPTPEPPAPNALPTIEISSPNTNTSHIHNTAISFRATAADAEDGDISNNIIWNSSIDGEIGTGTGNSISSTTLSIGTHTITASITDSNGELAIDTIVIIIAAAPPNAPTGLTATQSNLIVMLNWTNTANATNYKVYRSINNSAFSLVATVLTSSYSDNSFDINNNGDTIRYYVVANNSGGDSSNSATVSVDIPALPGRPNNINIIDNNLPDGVLVIIVGLNGDDDPIDLTFSTNSNSGFTDLRVGVTPNNDQRATYMGLTGSTFVSSSSVYIVHTGLVSNREYYYRAYSRNDVGRSIGFRSDNGSPS